MNRLWRLAGVHLRAMLRGRVWIQLEGRRGAMLLSEIDVLGYAASGLTLATFAQRTMLPMRLLALAANVCFIGYGAMGLYMPVLVLHLVLLPINLIRLRALVGPRSNPGDRPPEALVPSAPPPGLSSGLL